MAPPTKEKAIVLLSGGLDSATVLAVAIDEGFEVHALTFRYGQRHVTEVDAARRIAATHGVASHTIIDIDLRAFGGSALTSEIDVPKDRAAEQMVGSIPITYVPARNTIFLSFALACAEVRGADDIFIGVNALDYSGYPDCRPEFLAAFEEVARLGTKAGIEGRTRFRVRAPLVAKSKREIIELGIRLGVDYGETTSCYDPAPDGRSCGRCDACYLRLRGFREAGVTDPARYAIAGAAP